ncbi:MAG: hypothetical protein FD129_1591, partial [bacterium]
MCPPAMAPFRLTLEPAHVTANTLITTTLNWKFARSLAVLLICLLAAGGDVAAAPPAVTRLVPVDAATDVALDRQVRAFFADPMDPATISTSTFTLAGPGAAVVTGTVTYDAVNFIAIFSPSGSLAATSVYTPTITTGAKNQAGDSLASEVTWSFTTGSTSSAPGQARVDLGAAFNFAVLAGSTITNTGSTAVKGDLGLSPGGSFTGFPPGSVLGTIHLADSEAELAKAALTTAYNETALRTAGRIVVSADLGGQVLTPGLYWSEFTLALTSGDLTLDAEGDSAAVFVLQMGTTFSVATGRKVVLSGGAKASNVFWLVGTSATLGTN